jgi:Na+/H+ antiporter NhaD/arsenite permease-like protein
MSAVLDNAPTYLIFATMAAGSNDIGRLVQDRPDLLAAISCGAVFFGALTYIGNGPNFMVKAIAEQSHYPMPSFLRYSARAALVLLPIFVIMTLVFFRPF